MIARALRSLLPAIAIVPVTATADVASPSTTADELPPIRPDPRAVAEAREANLEPDSVREGLAIGVASGPSMQVGFGVRESSGTGGGFDLRIGTVASPRWVWLLEVAGTLYRQGDDQGRRVNQSMLVTLGGQLYLKDALWVRGGTGLAVFTRRTESMPEETVREFFGVGVIGAGGLDLYRRGSFALSGEVLVTAARYREGTVMGGTLQLGVSWY